METDILPDNSTFNHAAAQENERNKQHIKLTHGDGRTTLFIGREVTYHGIKTPLLSEEQKKKLENVILFSYLSTLQQVPKFVYR